MKIWIDARICDEPGYYWQFICELVDAFCKENSEHEIIVYRKSNLHLSRHSLIDEIKTKKIFESENFALMIFFDHKIPHGYKWDFYVMIDSLKEVFFPKKKWIHRKFYSYKLSKAIEKAKRVLVFDGGSALELNENLNVPEDKIKRFSAFFPEYNIPEDAGLRIDVKAQNNIRGDYLIYDSGNEVHNNFERILKTLLKLKEKWILINLVILCDSTNRDLDIRGKVIEYNIANQIFFLGQIPKEHEASYYMQSSGVIFSSIYESFPFHFTKALAYNCKIFANEIPANEHVMGESVYYLDPLSIHNMCDVISENIGIKNTHTYKNIHETFNASTSSSMLKKLIEAKD